MEGNVGSVAEVGQIGERRGAAVVIDVARQDAGATAAALTASLFAWARHPEIYALVLDGRRVEPGAALTPGEHPALAEAVWRLDCFSKPTVTLLGRDPATVVLALALAGTHRVIDPDATVRVRDLVAGNCPPAIILRALARMPDGERYLRTGAPITTPQAAEFVTHAIAPERIDSLIAALADAEPVDPLLDQAHQSPVEAPCSAAPPLALPAQTDTVLDLLPELAHLDLRAATLRLEALLRPNTRFDLPTRETLQSLRGR